MNKKYGNLIFSVILIISLLLPHFSFINAFAYDNGNVESFDTSTINSNETDDCIVTPVYNWDYSLGGSRPHAFVENTVAVTNENTFSLSYNSVTIDEGYAIRIASNDSSGQVVTWESSSPSVASICSTGNNTAQIDASMAGTTTITASLSSGEYATCEVTVALSDGVYYIKNDNLCLGVKGIQEGTAPKMLTQKTSGPAKIRQLWKIEYLFGGLYSIRSLYKLDMALESASDTINLSAIGTTNDVPTTHYWMISNTVSGTVFRYGANTTQAMQPYGGLADAGDSVVLSTFVSDNYYFLWDLEPNTSVTNQTLLINTQLGLPAHNAFRCLSPGDVCTLADMNLAASYVSQTTNEQNFTWAAEEEGIVNVDSSSGTVTGIGYGDTNIIGTKVNTNYTVSFRVVVCEIPISGSEVPYEPTLWKDEDVERITNCYSYAFNNQVRSGTNTLFRMQPGQLDDSSFLLAEITADSVIEAVQRDAETAGFMFEEIDKNGTCPSGTYKVALVIAPGQDYHWYRQNPDGTWSHKRGSSPVENIDADGNLIVDPETADRTYYFYDSENIYILDYSVFAGFFCVTPLNNMYDGTVVNQVTDSLINEVTVTANAINANYYAQEMTYEKIASSVQVEEESASE